MSISSMYKNTATELFLSYKAMLKKIYVHQNIHQSLIPLYLIHKKQTWEKNVHISDPDYQALFGFLLDLSQRISIQNIPTFYLFFFPITIIWNVFSHITQSTKTQGNISVFLTQKNNCIF